MIPFPQEVLPGPMGRLIVVSNREPFVHERRGPIVECSRPAGGVTAALDPLLARYGGVWIAQGSGSADRDTADGHSRLPVPPERPAYMLRRVWIPEPVRQAFYQGMANRALWPLCHHAYQRPRFSAAEWESYREVNERFAAAILEEAAGGPALVFIQDYHFGLLPRLLRRRNPRLKLAHFWHIPWPSPEIFSAFPWRRELIDGMLGSDLVGFHLRRHCTNFLASAEMAGGEILVRGDGCVSRGGRRTAVKPFPIGIDVERHAALASSAASRQAIQAWREKIGPGVRLGIGLDRLDYTKGIPERLRGLDCFLARHPEWREKLVFVQVGVPSRCDIPEYAALAREVRELVDGINARWRTAAWEPIRFVAENLPPEQMIALHRLADFCLVTPLHDGMNLVAKEFVASRSDLDGVLILSCFAGAAAELSSAVLVNPFAEEEIAGAIAAALNLSQPERMMRMSRMRAAVQANTVYDWAAHIFTALAETAAPERMVWRSRAAGAAAEVPLA